MTRGSIRKEEKPGQSPLPPMQKLKRAQSAVSGEKKGRGRGRKPSIKKDFEEQLGDLQPPSLSKVQTQMPKTEKLLDKEKGKRGPKKKAGKKEDELMIKETDLVKK